VWWWRALIGARAEAQNAGADRGVRVQQRGPQEIFHVSPALRDSGGALTRTNLFDEQISDDRVERGVAAKVMQKSGAGMVDPS